MFCIYFKLRPLPAACQTVQLFAQFLSRSFKSVQSIKNYLTGVKYLHLYVDLPPPDLKHFGLTLTCRGLARTKKHIPKQALPITPELLVSMFNHLDVSKPVDIAFWAACLLGFFLMLRKSNLVPVSHSHFNPAIHLCRGDIICQGQDLLVRIKWSKTLQCGGRTLWLPLVAFPGSCLCPVSAFKGLCSLANAPPQAPAFAYPSPSGYVTFTHSTFVAKLRHVLSSLGLPAHKYSGHSFRRGGATWAFAAGVPGELIQLIGDWSSDAYLRYLDVSLKSKVAAMLRVRDFTLANSFSS